MWKKFLPVAVLTLLALALVTTALFVTRREPEGPPGTAVRTDETNVSAELETAFVPSTVAVPEQWRMDAFGTPRTLELPEGFFVSVFASGFTRARMLALDGRGVLHVSDPDAGQILALPDADGNGVADERAVVADNLDYPHGLAFRNGDLYVAETGAIVRLRDTDGDGVREERVTLVDDLPRGGKHVTRTLIFGRDGTMYVSVGSSCNVCEDDPRRGVILRYNEDGTGETTFARGLRNAVGLALHPETGALWVTENGRDGLGDDLPPDEVNAVQEGSHYGWPYCFGDREADPRFDDVVRCATTEPPVLNLQAHSAPLGLTFFRGGQLPSEYENDLFIAFHGSAERTVPTGYKIVRASTDGSAQVEDFIRGWLTDGNAWGRPVDVLAGPDGSLFISDDKANVVYRVTYRVQ